jgi:hypothetical protein
VVWSFCFFAARKQPNHCIFGKPVRGVVLGPIEAVFRFRAALLNPSEQGEDESLTELLEHQLAPSSPPSTPTVLCGHFPAVPYAALFREAFVATDFLAASCAALIAAQRRFVPAMIALRPAAEGFRFLLGGSAEIG